MAALHFERMFLRVCFLAEHLLKTFSMMSRHRKKSTPALRADSSQPFKCQKGILLRICQGSYPSQIHQRLSARLWDVVRNWWSQLLPEERGESRLGGKGCVSWTSSHLLVQQRTAQGSWLHPTLAKACQLLSKLLA